MNRYKPNRLFGNLSLLFALLIQPVKAMDVDVPLQPPVVSPTQPTQLSLKTRMMKDIIASGYEIMVIGNGNSLNSKPIFLCKSNSSPEWKLVFLSNFGGTFEAKYDTFQSLFGLPQERVWMERTQVNFSAMVAFQSYILLRICEKQGSDCLYHARVLPALKLECDCKEESCFDCTESIPLVVGPEPFVYMDPPLGHYPYIYDVSGDGTGYINQVCSRKLNFVRPWDLMLPFDIRVDHPQPFSAPHFASDLLIYQQWSNSNLFYSESNLRTGETRSTYLQSQLEWPNSFIDNPKIKKIKEARIPFLGGVFKDMTLIANIRHSGRGGCFLWNIAEVGDSGFAGFLNRTLQSAFCNIYNFIKFDNGQNINDYLRSIYPTELDYKISYGSESSDHTFDVSGSICISEHGIVKFDLNLPLTEATSEVVKRIKANTMSSLETFEAIQKILPSFHISEKRFINPQKKVFHWFNFSGTECPYWVQYVPGLPDSPKRPIVFYVNGGPHTQKLDPDFHMLQHLVKDGFFVVFANYPGSTFDVASIPLARNKCLLTSRSYFASVYEEVVKLYPDVIDPDSVAFIGDSYGGLVATDMSLEDVDSPLKGKVKACVAVTPLLSADKSKTIRPELIDYVFGDNTALAPLERASKLSTPLLMLQGKIDEITLYEVTDEFCKRVKAANLEHFFTLVSFRYGGHDTGTEEGLTAYWALSSHFLRHHLNFWAGDEDTLALHRKNVGDMGTILDNAFAKVEAGDINFK